MGMAIKGVLALFWLGIIPLGAGRALPGSGRPRACGEYILTGYLLLFSLMEILTLPMIWLKAPLHILVWCYGLAAAALAVYGAVRGWKKTDLSGAGRVFRGHSLYFWAALAVILFQLVICTVLAHMDADDSFYVAAAVTDVQTDTIFQINPYTGREYRQLPTRYVFSPFPVFLAVVSQLAGGLHPAVMAHVIFPAVFLPLSYLVQYKIAGKWFRGQKRMQDVYLFVCACITGFSAYSVYNAENFRMVRIWQGKALLASLMLPLLFYLCMTVFTGDKPEYPGYFPGLANLSCCLLSSMGILLAPLLMGCWGILYLFQTRRLKALGKVILNCLPSIILGVLYLLYRYMRG